MLVPELILEEVQWHPGPSKVDGRRVSVVVDRVIVDPDELAGASVLSLDSPTGNLKHRTRAAEPMLLDMCRDGPSRPLGKEDGAHAG
jgi:hypothetical protein